MVLGTVTVNNNNNFEFFDFPSAGLRHGQTRQLPGAPAKRGAEIEKIRGAERIKGAPKKLKGR